MSSIALEQMEQRIFRPQVLKAVNQVEGVQTIFYGCLAMARRREPERPSVVVFC